MLPAAPFSDALRTTRLLSVAAAGPLVLAFDWVGSPTGWTRTSCYAVPSADRHASTGCHTALVGGPSRAVAGDDAQGTSQRGVRSAHPRARLAGSFYWTMAGATRPCCGRRHGQLLHAFGVRSSAMAVSANRARATADTRQIALAPDLRLRHRRRPEQGARGVMSSRTRASVHGAGHAAPAFESTARRRRLAMAALHDLSTRGIRLRSTRQSSSPSRPGRSQASLGRSEPGAMAIAQRASAIRDGREPMRGGTDAGVSRHRHPTRARYRSATKCDAMMLDRGSSRRAHRTSARPARAGQAAQRIAAHLGATDRVPLARPGSTDPALDLRRARRRSQWLIARST